jgi:serine/threonine protein kinase
MGGGGSKYAIEPTSEKVRPCNWLLTSADHVTGSFRMDAFSLKMVIGKGKFGLVYTAQHVATTKHVAIKFISKQIIFETKGVQRIQQVCVLCSILPV